MKHQLKLLHEQLIIGLVTTVSLGLVNLLYPWKAIFLMAVISAIYSICISVIVLALLIIDRYLK
ncbi:hypothetical protein FC60_GL000407 [Limosilactobacillus gastricus DSM 16045]|uniref:Uncharacterized protein n=1 Tax=Limosilactobacillus gastricus DSM 16045 TaxID=1423749 RepID=A0A0R1V9A5_9LACO|nr:hypothetical protein FC60_GL000407 [Limosilactobacillus gastricus DSM 16045]